MIVKFGHVLCDVCLKHSAACSRPGSAYMIACGLCIDAGLQQTPQEIWDGLEATLPALQGLLTSCSEVLICGTLT